MSLNSVRLSRSRMYDLLTKLALIMEPEYECLELVCVGGASLIMFDDSFQEGMSTDIDAFMIDLSRFEEKFCFDIDETAYQENEANPNAEKLEYDWLNDEIARDDLYKEIDIDEFLEFLDYSKEVVFPNRKGEPGISLVPANADIVIMAKILSNRFKDGHVIDRFIKMNNLHTLDDFHDYFEASVPLFIEDPRYVRALAYMGKNVDGTTEEMFCDFLDEHDILFEYEKVEEYLREEKWGDPLAY